ncbi:hypothetical protein GCM10027074_27970 [Streptomyces deserti]
MEDLAGLLRGADEALGDEVDEAGDVLEAGGGRGVGAEDADALACGLGELGAGSEGEDGDGQIAGGTGRADAATGPPGQPVQLGGGRQEIRHTAGERGDQDEDAEGGARPRRVVEGDEDRAEHRAGQDAEAGHPAPAGLRERRREEPVAGGGVRHLRGQQDPAVEAAGDRGDGDRRDRSTAPAAAGRGVDGVGERRAVFDEFGVRDQPEDGDGAEEVDERRADGAQDTGPSHRALRVADLARVLAGPRSLHPDAVDHSWVGQSGNGFLFDHLLTAAAQGPQARAFAPAPRPDGNGAD